MSTSAHSYTSRRKAGVGALWARPPHDHPVLQCVEPVAVGRGQIEIVDGGHYGTSLPRTSSMSWSWYLMSRLVGSSSTSTAVCWARARAISTRCFSPPDRWRTLLPQEASPVRARISTSARSSRLSVSTAACRPAAPS